MTKTCTTCKTEKLIDHFHRDSYQPDGRKIYCKDCCRKRQKEAYDKNPELHIQRVITRRNERQSGAPLLKRQGLSVEEAQQIKKDYRRHYKQAHKHEISQKMREYNARLHVKEMTRTRLARRRANDPAFATIGRLRCRIKNACKSGGAKKAYKTEELIGCTVDQFRMWIEMHFSPGMTWENYGHLDGQWSYDHYYPCTMFDLTIPEEQKECFSWKNTYPMWHKENVSKGCRLPPPLSAEREAEIAAYEAKLSALNKKAA